MNKIERTIRELQLYVGIRWGGSNDMFNLALAALQEHQERSKGCEWCDNFKHDWKYCGECGKRLEVEHDG